MVCISCMQDPRAAHTHAYTLTRFFLAQAPCNGRGTLASNGVSDCERCDTCANGQYAAGVGRCTGNGIWKDKFNCTECKPCPSGYEHTVACDGTSFNDTCKLCPPCPTNHHISSYWNETSKRMVCGCTKCLDSAGDVCSTHQYKTNLTCSGTKPYDEVSHTCRMSFCLSDRFHQSGCRCTALLDRVFSYGHMICVLDKVWVRNSMQFSWKMMLSYLTRSGPDWRFGDMFANLRVCSRECRIRAYEDLKRILVIVSRKSHVDSKSCVQNEFENFGLASAK